MFDNPLTWWVLGLGVVALVFVIRALRRRPDRPPYQPPVTRAKPPPSESVDEP